MASKKIKTKQIETKKAIIEVGQSSVFHTWNKSDKQAFSEIIVLLVMEFCAFGNSIAQ